MSLSTIPRYFIQSNKVLLSIAISFFLTNCVELLLIVLVDYVSSVPTKINMAVYFLQSLLLVASLWFSFRFIKNTQIYLIAFSTAVIYLLLVSAVVFIDTPSLTIDFIFRNLICSFVLIFMWMHLTQNLENKTKALKIGYVSYFIFMECLSQAYASLKGESQLLFFLSAIIGYRISAMIFELMLKICFKLLQVETHNP